MGFHDRSANSQAHAGSVDLCPLIPSAIEFFEDERLFEIVDARPAVGDVDGDHLVLRFGRDADRSFVRGIFRGVIDQMYQNFLDMRRVHTRLGKVVRDHDVHRMMNEELLQFFERLLDHWADWRSFKAEFDFVGVELRHFGGFSDQAVQSIALFVDDGQQLMPVVGRMA